MAIWIELIPPWKYLRLSAQYADRMAEGLEVEDWLMEKLVDHISTARTRSKPAVLKLVADIYPAVLRDLHADYVQTNEPDRYMTQTQVF